MKILIILATAMLVPIMMKFQARTIITQSNPKTAQQVSQVLIEHQVNDPMVAVRYLEATIAGRVASEAEAESVVKEVNQIRGVDTVKSLLIIQGWMKVQRVGSNLSVEGVIPSAWRSELLKEQPLANTENLEWRDSAELAGKSAVTWGLFIDEFLRPEGDRALSLSGNRLLISGEVTPSQLAIFRQKSQNLGEDISFESETVVRASPYHFETRILTSPIEGEPLRSLSQKLTDSFIAFQPQSTQFTLDGFAKASLLVAHILQSPPEVTFVIGGHPDDSGPKLAQQRAQKVQAFLIENGIPANRLKVIPFEMTEDEGGVSGQVELLVR